MSLIRQNTASILIVVDDNNVAHTSIGDNFGPQLLYELSEIFNGAILDNSDITTVDFRLYGAWPEEGIFTTAASRISQVIDLDPFFLSLEWTENQKFLAIFK